MEYQTLYRRWRPHKFSDFVGQSHVVTTLSNAIESDRTAHAYLFTGPRGTGKTSVAKIFAKALNCEARSGAEPCDECNNCQRINDGTLMDVIEIDAASNRGIDEIRDLREKVKFAPAEGKYKIYIIDEVHMLTSEAFNALLKTLEEPPSFVVFILATTEVHKIPATILSRCQRFDFKRFTLEEIKGRLSQIVTAEGLTSSDEALYLIAEYAEGGMRDAVSLLEQALAHSQGHLEVTSVRAILGLIDQEEIDRMTNAIQQKDTKLALDILSEVNLSGKDLFQFGRSMIGHFREMLLSSLTHNESAMFTPAELIRTIEIFAAATNEVKRSQQNALPLELALIKLTTQSATSDLEARVAKLEALIQSGHTVPVSAATVSTPTISPVAASVSAPKQANIPSGKAQPVAQQASAPVNLEEIKPGSGKNIPFDWPAFLEQVKQKKRTLAALIQEGKLLKFEDGQFIVGMPPNLKFHLDNLNITSNKEILESIIQQWLGVKVSFSCIPIPEPGQAEKPSGNPQGPDLVAKTIAIFGGEARPVSKEEP